MQVSVLWIDWISCLASSHSFRVQQWRKRCWHIFALLLSFLLRWLPAFLKKLPVFFLNKEMFQTPFSLLSIYQITFCIFSHLSTFPLAIRVFAHGWLKEVLVSHTFWWGLISTLLFNDLSAQNLPRDKKVLSNVILNHFVCNVSKEIPT